jgi:tetratricopeptide (TPR) repeat protein
VIGSIGIALATVIGLRREQAQRQEAELARDEAAATATFLTELLASPAPESQGRDVRVVELLNTAVLRAQSQPDLSRAPRAALLLTIGRSQLALHRFRDADATLTHAMALDTPEQPLASAQALQIGLHLADVRSRRQHFEEAGQVLQRLASDPRWRSDATAKVETAIRRAGWWFQQGKLDEAQTALSPVLERAAELPVETRIHALVTQGMILFEQRRLQETEAAARNALDLLESSGQRFGNREFELRLMLGNAYSAQGRNREAEATYRALAVDVAKAFGESSLSISGVWINVAVSLNDQGRHDEAAALLRDWMPKVEALEGADSSRMILLRSNLAVALQLGGKTEEALAEHGPVITMSERVFGAEHPQTLVARFNRVEALNDAGRSELALDEGQALRETMISALGAQHPFTLETEDAIGFAMTRLGRADEAQTLHRHTIEGKTAALGADNPYTLVSQEYLARALIAMRRHDEARTTLAALLVERERVLGAKHPKTLVTRELQASIPP